MKPGLLLLEGLPRLVFIPLHPIMVSGLTYIDLAVVNHDHAVLDASIDIFQSHLDAHDEL